MDRVREIMAILEQTYPDARTELEFETPFQLLVATMMAAQSTDKQVNKVTRVLFHEYGTPERIAALSEEAFAKMISSVGLYRNKGRAIVQTSRILLQKHAGEVPGTREELEALPGVGRKTANVVLSNAFGIPAFAVDTHVFRVSRRLRLADGSTPMAVERQLMDSIPEEHWGLMHHHLILHGRRICLARNPKCVDCPLLMLCDSPARTV